MEVDNRTIGHTLTIHKKVRASTAEGTPSVKEW